MKKTLSIIYMFVLCHYLLMAQISGQVNLRSEDLSFSKQAGYDVIRIDGADDFTDRIGAPELPVITKTYVVPLDVKVTGVHAEITKTEELKRNVLPYPVQVPVPINDNNRDTDEFALDSSIYAGTAVYPGEYAEIVADYNEMGYHLVRIRINPIAWDPTSGKLYLNEINFALIYSRTDNAYQSPLTQSRHRSNIVKTMIKSMVDNPQDVELYADKKVKIGNVASESSQERSNSNGGEMYIDVLKEQIPDYIIITNRELHEEFQRLADWKIQKGIPTIIKDIEDIRDEYIGSDLQEKIHAYLQECYMKWGEGLFVLLGGDTNIVPARFYTAISKYEDNLICPSDAYYSDVTSDWNPNKDHLYAERGKDVFELNRNSYIGRASVENKKEATLFINKVLAYEKMNSQSIDTGYLMNHLAISAYIEKGDLTGKLSQSAKMPIDNYFKEYVQLNEHKWYLFDHYNCNCNKHSDKRIYDRGQELNKANLMAALNDGGASGLNHFHIVYHMDHCSPRAMGTSCKDKLETMSIQEIDNLQNGDFLQIVISGGCETTQFEKDCVAEHFINNPNGGAVAFIGNSNVGLPKEYTQYKFFLDGLYGFNNPSLGIIFSKMTIPESYTPNYMACTPNFMRLHLIGDPEMPVWSAIPQQLDADANVILLDSRPCQVAIKIKNLPEGEKAKVCLLKDKEIYLAKDINDRQQHIFTIDAKSAGKLKVTVTARNCIPFEKELNVYGTSIGKGPIAINKISGFDGSVNIGDSATLGISLKNVGGTDAVNVKASLSTNSPYVRIIEGSNIEYSVIPAHGNAERNFKIAVCDNAVEVKRNEWNGVCLYLRTKDDANTYSIDTFRVDITSPKLRIERIAVASTGNGNLTPEAGETVKLKLDAVRLGTATDRSVNWKVMPMSDNINDVMVNNSVCTFRIANDYALGNPLKLKILLSSGDIPQDSCTVNIAESLPMIGKDMIHSSQTENTISLYWDKESSVTKYNIYRSSTLTGEYVKMNKIPLTIRYYCDENLPIRTAYYYKLSAVSESCLEGSLSEPFMAMTSVPVMLHKEELAISGNPYLYENEVNTVDLDYDGQKEIVLTSVNSADNNKSAVVVVKPDGTEPYCIDGNATTFGGFALLDWYTSAVPAVADLYGNGEMSIVSLSRIFGDAVNYVTCYSSLDKDNNNLPDMLWQTQLSGASFRGAVITDIDVPNGKGEKEIIFVHENKGIVILNADGTERLSFGEEISSCYCGLAVADMDGDGYKEIICGNGPNLYVWNHDGTPFMRYPFFTRNGMNLKSSPVVCDLDGDGEKEIVVASRSSSGNIYAIKLDGTCVGNFDSMASVPAKIPYPSDEHQGLDHAVSVGDINSDGHLEVVSLGGGCVGAWTCTGKQIFNRNISGLFPNVTWNTHFAMPLLADIDGDSYIDIIFNMDNKICAIDNQGNDIQGYQLSGDYEFSNNISVSDIDNDGKNEIIAADISGFITVWKTEGSMIEWGRTRFDTGFTGEYVFGYRDVMVVKSDTVWHEGSFPNDIIVRSGTLKIPSGGNLNMLSSCRLIVMDGGSVVVDGGSVTNAGIYVKSGGSLMIRNNGNVKLGKYASFDTEKGALIDIDYGYIEYWHDQ